MNNMIQQRVAAVLLKHPETKDDDRMLTAYYWTMQMADEGLRLETFDDFKREYTFGKLTDAQTITRIRRKLQMERPQFRGKKYLQKMAKQQKVKSDLGYSDNLLYS